MYSFFFELSNPQILRVPLFVFGLYILLYIARYTL